MRWDKMRTDLSASANLAGRIGMSGAVRKATKKQIEAPNKHAPKPINLEQEQMEGEMIHMQGGKNMTFNTYLSHLERAK